MGAKTMTNVQTPLTDAQKVIDSLSDDEVELLSKMEGKNRHVSRAIAKRHGYTWKQVQALRKRYLESIGKGE
jgi:hypothetical protein